MSENQERERAREKAELRLAFRWHAAVFTAVNLLLVGVWYFSGAGLPWFVFPLGGWGIGLAAHGYAAYGSSQDGWVDRETERILAQERIKPD
jgi:hypothetical protein